MAQTALIHQLFPTFVLQEKIFSSAAKINSELTKECYKFREIDLAGRKWSQKNYSGGYTSYGSITTLHKISPTFEELGKKIDAAARKFARDLEMDIKPRDLQMSSMWINIMPPGVTHSMHIHPLSVISGTYYLQIPKGTRGLKFEDPRMVNFMASPPRKANVKKANQRFVEMVPRVGEILLFESWLRHEVPPNPVRSERLSISFNYEW